MRIPSEHRDPIAMVAAPLAARAAPTRGRRWQETKEPRFGRCSGPRSGRCRVVTAWMLVARREMEADEINKTGGFKRSATTSITSDP